jgi:hypothetical protein
LDDLGNISPDSPPIRIMSEDLFLAATRSDARHNRDVVLSCAPNSTLHLA